MSLRDDDLERLRGFGIDAELIAAAGIRRVTDAEARDLLGISNHHGNLSGVAVPRVHPRDGETRAWRLRRDHPESENGKPKNKYLTTPGRQRLYFPPASAALLTDVTAPMVLVEADTSALASVAAAARAGRRLLAIGLGGCWGWRGRIGKTTDATGARVDEHGPVPDLDLITWNNRETVVALDANAATNSKVKTARRALAAELRKRGARVRIAEVPAVDGVNGLDDLRARHGDAAVLALVDDARGDDGDEPSSTNRRERSPSQATQLIELALRAWMELWHTPGGDAYATLRVSGHMEHHPLRRAVRDVLARDYFRTYRRAASSAALTDALATLGGMARHDGPEHSIAVRLAEHDGALYIDLGDPEWRAIEIAPDGWRVLAEAPVRFWRPASLRALPDPMSGGSVDELRHLWPLDADAWTLTTGWLVAALAPRGPYPVLVLAGEQGSGKSTLGRMLRGLIDPASPELRGAPHDERDVMIGALTSRVVAFDNLSGLPAWLSDALCRVSTGGGLATRTLFTDTDETLIDVMRPILMTGIDSPATRGDLLDRALVVTLPMMPDEARGAEADLWARYNKMRPRVLGALLDAVSTALARRAGVRLSRLPRMADACIWVSAAEPALGWADGRALAAWTGARAQASADLLAGNAVASAVLDISDTPWQGTAGELLSVLNARVPEAIRSGRDWPRSPRGLAGTLRRLAPDLRRAGLDVQEPKPTGHDRRRVLTIVRIVRTDYETPVNAPTMGTVPANRCAEDPADDCQQACSQRSATARTRGTDTLDLGLRLAPADGAIDADGSSRAAGATTLGRPGAAQSEVNTQ